MTNYSETIYWLALVNESGLKLNIIKPIIMRWCLNDQRRLSELFALTPFELSTTFGLAEADAARILKVGDRLAAHAKAMERWQAEGLELLTRTDPRYPDRLANNLAPALQPLVLWTKGPVELLNKPGVTMLGHHSQDRAMTAFTTDLINRLEAEQIGLVSGYSRGLDRATYEMLMATADGYATVILPMGLTAFAQTTNKLDAAIRAGRTLLVSPFAPDTSFNEKLADARNMLIDHLTLALLILESDEEAETRATAALDRGLPVFVKADTTGNRALIDRGALLLTDSGEVVDWVQQALVDEAMLESDVDSRPPSEEIAAAPLSVTAPKSPEPSSEDYSLTVEDVSMLDSDEALEILSLGGEVPDVLRRRLEDAEPE